MFIPPSMSPPGSTGSTTGNATYSPLIPPKLTQPSPGAERDVFIAPTLDHAYSVVKSIITTLDLPITPTLIKKYNYILSPNGGRLAILQFNESIPGRTRILPSPNTNPSPSSIITNHGSSLPCSFLLCSSSMSPGNFVRLNTA